MLRRLTIRDYAIIDGVELAFDDGLTVLSGETGAGKSIIVDALGLVLGDRADSSAVRHGCERAEITAEFDAGATAAIATWLEDNDLTEGDECILRRVVGADGRSRGYINGRPTPMSVMRELGERLVDIHGQHEHQSLLRRDAQAELLDAHGGHDAPLTAVADAFDAWHAADQAWRSLHTAAAERADRLDLLRFQLKELSALALEHGEIDTLEAEHIVLANAGRLQEAAQSALTLADGEDEVHARALLHRAVEALADVAGMEPRLGAVHQLLEQASIQLGEGADDLRRWLDGFELDPERKAWVEQRIGTAHQLARKHHVEPDELPALSERLQAEFAELDHADERLEELAQERARQESAYRKAATTLHAARTTTAQRLASSITDEMQSLGMQGGAFDIRVEHDAARFSRGGSDTVEFLVATNPGQPARALAKTASGGELSRISLGIQVTAAHAKTIACLIFDEVDAGVGGAVAEIVGQRLRKLSAGRQVLCVTHLPQVASQAHHHFRVSKAGEDGGARTVIESLDDKGRVEELARMLGGLKVTDKVRATAREMLRSAAS
jgi:DNA repair protein RecN (Recombination protein N)